MKNMTTLYDQENVLNFEGEHFLNWAFLMSNYHFQYEEFSVSNVDYRNQDLRLTSVINFSILLELNEIFSN